MLWFIFTMIFVSASNQELQPNAGINEVLSPWITSDYGRLVFPIYNAEPISVQTPSNVINASGHSGPCTFEWIWKNLFCNGDIDHDLIRILRLTRIKNFIVNDYRADLDVKPGKKFRIDFIDDAYKLAGDIFSTDIGIGLRISVDISPNDDLNGFVIRGDAYSNELRVGWQVEGIIGISETNNTYELACQVSTVEESGWVFTARVLLTADDWIGNIEGTVDADFFLTPLSFTSQLRSQEQMDMSWKIVGDAKVKPLLIVWNVQATLTPSVNEEITIPSGIFKNSKIKHMLFRNAVFMGDLDKDALQGITNLETITFLDSKLEEIPRFDYLFNNITSIKAIYLEKTSMPDVSFGVSQSLPNLELFSLKGSGPIQLDGNSFKWLEGSNLTYINFQDCNIKIKFSKFVTDAILKPVGKTLRYVDLSYTSLTDASSLEAMLKGVQLTHLSLAGLQLSKVPRVAMEYVSKSIEYLSFRGNVFHKVPEENMFFVILDFPLMPNLKELDLKRCSINYIETGAFDQLPALQRLYLSYNELENVQEGWYGLQPSVMHIDLSWNKVNVIPEPTTEFSIKPGGGLKNLGALEIVDLSNAVFTYLTDIVKSLPNTTKTLSLCNTALPSNAMLQDLHLPKLQVLDLSGNPAINFSSTDTLKFLNSLTNLRTLHARQNGITNCFFTGIQDFITLRKSKTFIQPLITLNLTANNIKTLKANAFSCFPNLNTVDLTGNSIAAWSVSLSLGPNLKKLKLNDNKIETLTDVMLKDFSGLRELEIGRNPFQCDCGAEKLANAMNQGTGLCAVTRLNRNVFAMKINKRDKRSINTCVKITDWDIGYDYYCYGENSDEMEYLKNLNSSGLCAQVDKIVPAEVDADLNVLYIITAVSLVLGIVAAFIYWKWWEIRLLTRAVRNAAILSFLNRKDEDAPSIQYSAFVSYSDKDRPWVLQQLLPRLEEWSEVNVCLHERDFQVGISIMENITYSIERSRNLVLVLSQAFVMSQWCQFELHLAQHRFIESRRDRLVLVLLETIPSYKKPKSLRYLMRTNTYLEWPGDQKPAEIERFWDRLLKSLNRDVTI